MSGSSPGDPPDDRGGRRDRDRDQQVRNVGDERPPRGNSSTESTSDDAVTIEDDGVVRWFLKSDDGNVVFVRDVASSVAIVVVIGLVLFGISGIWPPLVAVESPSMNPNMKTGDLIFVVDEDRYVGDDPVEGTGVVPLENAKENSYERFNKPGDVIVYRPGGSESATPIIHRAHFWIEENENWVETKADEEIIGNLTCEEVRTCPAPHDGFITKGDNNDNYDQIEGQSTVVRPEWITGKARFGIPWLGHVRLAFDSIFGGVIAPSPVLDATPATAGIDQRVVQGTVAGATGLAGTGGGLVAAIGRYRN